MGSAQARARRCEDSRRGPRLRAPQLPASVPAGLRARQTDPLGLEAVVYHCTVHDWYGRQHFYQGLARAFARRRSVLYVTAPVTIPRSRGRGPAGEATCGGHLAQVGEAEGPGLAVFQPTVPRGARFRAVRELNERRVARASGRVVARLGLATPPPIVWCFAPDGRHLLRVLPGAIGVYWTGDEVVLPGERELLEAVDLVFAVSPPALAEKRSAVGERAVEMPMAIDPEPFVRARSERLVPPELAPLPRPLVGYGGALNWRLDWEALEAVASSTKGTLVLVGPAIDEEAERGLARLRALRTVRWLGHRPEESAPRHLAAFDVALIPYRCNRFNLGSNPVKFYEYLAAGLPVVSSDLPALRPFAGLVHQAQNPQQVARAVEEAARMPAGAWAERRRQEVARRHSYEALVERVEREIDRVKSDRG